MSVLDLARPEIRALQPYSSARMEASGGRIFLNANESAWAPPGDGDLACNRYPDPQPVDLVEALARLYGVDPAQIIVGRGSDEVIDLLVRAFCRAGEDAIAIQPPTFGMYAVSAQIQNAGIVAVPLQADFTLDVDAVLAAVTPAVKLVFVCTPNNPTGQLVPLRDVTRLAQALADRALLVVDEAYLEFSDAPSAASLVNQFDNLAVLRTLSKAWALAGARIGSLVANEAVIGLLRRIIAPYPLPRPCVALAMQALSDEGQAAARSHMAIVREQRERMRRALAEMPGVREVLPSHANFLAIRHDDAAAVYQCLRDAGILVRDIRRYPRLGDALRITVGLPEENDRVLEVLQQTATATVDGSASGQRA
jgi:histidinol-phosphate aminotransferase